MNNCPEGKIYNPKTKRCINDTPTNRKKLGLNVKSKSVSSKKNSSHHNSIPPMGPLIHPEFIKTHDIDIDSKKKLKQLKKNYIQMYNYLYDDRIPKILDNEEPLSLMEKNDLLELSNIVSKELQEINLLDNDNIKIIREVENKLKDIFKKGNVINDQPIKRKCGNWYIEPLRYKNRLQLLNIYDIIRDTIAGLEGSIKSNHFQFLTTHQEIDSTIRYKDYIDELIRLKVFTHDDLYKNMFESENVFDELAELHKKYFEAYKKTKKNNNA